RKRARSAASSVTVQPYPAGAGDCPNPGRSGRITRQRTPSRGTHAYQAREDSALPCTSTTVRGVSHGGPNQSSAYAIVAPGRISIVFMPARLQAALRCALPCCAYSACAPSPPSGGEGRGEAVSPRVVRLRKGVLAGPFGS